MADLPFPEFPMTVVPEIGDAILRRIDGRPALAEFFRARGGVHAVELEDVFFDQSYSTDALLVALEAVEERTELSGSATLTTAWQFTFVTSRMRTADAGTQRWLRARQIEDLKAALAASEDGAGPGVLHDLDGEPLTEALVIFQRAGSPIVVGETIRTSLTAAYTSQITQQTRAFEG